MKLIRSPWLSAVTALILGISIGIVSSVHAEKSQSRLPVDDVRMLSQVLERIKQAYVEDVDDSELLESAIEGMLSGLDPHSDYLTPEDFADLRESTSGEFGGLGIEITLDDTGFVRIVAPIDDTPAYRAGLQSGDLITQINDTPVKGMTINDAVTLMRGKPGTSLTLTIAREGENKPLEFEITRDIIQVTSIRSRMLEPGFGYVRISQFQERTGQDFIEAMESLRDENDGSLDGLVLDLRNNPGGVLQASVDVVDALISDGLIVYTEGRLPNSASRFTAHGDDPSDGVNLVVLINGGSASASEIVAGAVQDHQRGVIMGTRSFGKGSVQTILPLDQEHAIKLTTARYFTPSGRSIQAQGIVPDIEVRPGKLTQENGNPYYTEADLAGHLANPEGENGSRDRAEKGEESQEQQLIDDYQLYQALTMLKGMRILNAAR
ncbi:S41 family peptidase [Saccharospirillum salsuginis]|uniref:Carboxyl-terminal protease n=1 Tax=Saccharospirillum salsuginis TaxID=418750 RepID=A0A918K3Q1_9GAMM|nr:S41 family peptidase [Saccharospirillum salsuginis]GGX46107.1 carboxyl-terminal protease [Saccharospirillum salsuginis]